MIKSSILAILVFICSANAYSNSNELNKLHNALAASDENADKISLLLRIVEQERANNLTAAIHYGKQAVLLAKNLKEISLEAQSLLSLANSYYAKGIYDKALMHGLSALRVYEQVNNTSGLMKSYKTIGTVYLSMQNFEKAKQYLQLATEYIAEHNDPVFNAELLISIAGVHVRQGNTAKALTVMQRVLTILTNHKQTLLYSAALNNMGRLYYLNKNFDKAAYYYQQCIDLGKALEQKNIALHAQINLSKVQSETQQYEAAEVSALAAHQLALNSKAEVNIVQSALWLSEFYEHQKNHAKALSYHRIYIQYKDLQFNSEKTQQIADVQAKYDSDKKDAELALKQEIIQRQQDIHIAMSLFMLLLAISAVIAIKLYRDKKAANEQLKQQTIDLLAAKNEIEHLANHDTLTGLANINLATDRIETAIKNAKRSKSQIAVLFLDLDGFKEINDTFSHQAGDLVLTTTAQRILSQLREVDTACRFGGDEFLVLLVDIKKPQEINQVCQRLITTIGESMTYQNKSINVGVSIGAAIYPEHGQTADKLRNKADKLMYEVKRSGKNNYKIG